MSSYLSDQLVFFHSSPLMDAKLLGQILAHLCESKSPCCCDYRCALRELTGTPAPWSHIHRKKENLQYPGAPSLHFTYEESQKTQKLLLQQQQCKIFLYLRSLKKISLLSSCKWANDSNVLLTVPSLNHLVNRSLSSPPCFPPSLPLGNKLSSPVRPWTFQLPTYYTFWSLSCWSALLLYTHTCALSLRYLSLQHSSKYLCLEMQFWEGWSLRASLPVKELDSFNSRATGSCLVLKATDPCDS